ncbi:DUF4440 domain-containing protein [Filobacillus milosensis]|uniref:DUF4440 domain-containing protein n=1 Tax=Filobacillus milosensis TaxID=94137 RepID=A0A4Y8IKY7_9BACI|nr:DUF4440 domain-containing protein [Filobacillus milosensis]TFB21814.1 DUF4440 domain-containing protein [Filobacillus milosensis]
MEDLSVHLKELEETLLLKRKKDFEQLLADDFLEFGSSGRVFNKQDQLDTFDETGIHQRSWEYVMSDFHMEKLGEGVALVTFRVFDKHNNRHSLRSSIWKLNNGQWQMFFHQGTITNKSPEL